jgi:hypothetical protein
MLPARYVRGLLALSSHFLHISDYFSINYSDSSQKSLPKRAFTASQPMPGIAVKYSLYLDHPSKQNVGYRPAGSIPNGKSMCQ